MEKPRSAHGSGRCTDQTRWTGTACACLTAEMQPLSAFISSFFMFTKVTAPLQNRKEEGDLINIVKNLEGFYRLAEPDDPH